MAFEGRPSIHARQFIFTPKDLAAYSDLLVNEFPRVRFFEQPTKRETDSENPTAPDLRFRSSLADCGYDASIAFDHTWIPQWIPPGGEFHWWRLENSPIPNGAVDAGGFFTDPDGSQRLEGGRIYIRCHHDDKQHAALARRVLRLIAKVATNRCQCLRYPSFEVLWRKEKGHNEWIGHDAARWARESPDRLLAVGGGLAIGLRPLD